MESNKYKCKVCKSDIDSYDFFATEDMEEFFCSEDCCKKNYNEMGYNDYRHISTCGGYYDCKKLNNISDMCQTDHEIHFSQMGMSTLDFPVHRCPPAEISIIRTNMKLYDFVKKSEEHSSKLNEETLELTKSNVRLAKVMLILTAVNVCGVIVQISLQLFCGG